MDHLQEVLDLSIVFTVPPPSSSPEVLASIIFQCDTLSLYHTGDAFTDPLTQSERDDLLWYLEEYWKWPYLEFAERGKRVEALLSEVGKRLYNALFGGKESQNIVQMWQQQVSVQRRISIISEIASILRLPWELLSNPQGFLTLHSDHPVSIVRQLTKNDQTALTTSFQLPLRILLVTARPEGAGFVDPRSISRELVDELQRQSEARTIELEFLRPPTFAALSDRLKNTDRPIHVLHFDGHGGLGGKKQQGVLLFEDRAGKQSSVEASDLAKTLKNSGVRLAVLTACQSAMGTREDDAFSSVSTQLLKNGVDAVIAMSSSILVTSAARYAEAFYHALAEGLPVSIAHEQARQALQRNPHRHLFRHRRDEETAPVKLFDWWVPHFYQQRPVLLQLTSPNATSEQPSLIPPRFTLSQEMRVEPRYSFSGRAHELLQIERSLLKGKLVVISGFGGVGKTALAYETADWLMRTGMYKKICFVSFEDGGDSITLLSMPGHSLMLYDSHDDSHDIQSTLSLLGQALKEIDTLVIVDNLEGILPGEEVTSRAAICVQLRDVLLELTNKSAGVIVTSRDTLLSSQWQKSRNRLTHLLLGGLHPDDAYILAVQVLEDVKIDRAQVSYSSLRDILIQLDHHPLAIQLVLPVLCKLPVSRIRDDFGGLLPQFSNDTMRGRNQSLLDSLSYSLQRLSEDQQAQLATLAVFEGGANENDLLTITKIPKLEWIQLRAVLEQVALLTREDIPGINVPFLHFHPVLIPFLRNWNYTLDSTLQSRYAYQYFSLALYLYQKDTSSPQPTRMLLQRELPNMYHSLRLLQKLGDFTTASVMMNCLGRFFYYFGLEAKREELQRQIAEVNIRRGSPKSETLIWERWLRESALGEAEYQKGDLLAASTHFENLLALIQTLEGPLVGQGSYTHCLTLNRLARCFSAQGQQAAAEKLLREALIFIDALIKEQPSEELLHLYGMTLVDLGDTLVDQGSYVQAQKLYDKGRDVAIQQQDKRSLAVSLAQLGTLALVQGEYPKAQTYYNKALHHIRELDEPAVESQILYQLGRLAEEQSEWSLAEQYYVTSLEIRERLGYEMQIAETYNQLAIISENQNRSTEAEGWYKRALTIVERIQPQGRLLQMLYSNLAGLLVHKAQIFSISAASIAQARAYAERALAMQETFDTVEEIWLTLETLADIAALEGRTKDVNYYRRRERETFAAFVGNRSEIDEYLGPVIDGVALASIGDSQARADIEAALPQFEEESLPVAAIRCVLAGERNWHLLTEKLHRYDALLILRILETIGQSTEP